MTNAPGFNAVYGKWHLKRTADKWIFDQCGTTYQLSRRLGSDALWIAQLIGHPGFFTTALIRQALYGEMVR